MIRELNKWGKSQRKLAGGAKKDSDLWQNSEIQKGIKGLESLYLGMTLKLAGSNLWNEVVVERIHSILKKERKYNQTLNFGAEAVAQAVKASALPTLA